MSRIPPDQPPFPLTPGSSDEPSPSGGRPNVDTAWSRTFVVSAGVFVVLLGLRLLVVAPDADEAAELVGFTAAPAVICLLLVGVVASRSRRVWSWWRYVAWVVAIFLVLSLLVATGQGAGQR